MLPSSPARSPFSGKFPLSIRKVSASYPHIIRILSALFPHPMRKVCGRYVELEEEEEREEEKGGDSEPKGSALSRHRLQETVAVVKNGL